LDPDVGVIERIVGFGEDGFGELYIVDQGVGSNGEIFKLVDMSSDSDDDGIPDGSDACPFVQDPDQRDTDGNDLGDVCQCGDLDGDGITNVIDALAIARGEVSSSDPQFEHCDVNGDGSCNVADALMIARGEVSSLPEEQLCPAYLGSAAP
jgi:hypothetical protein